MAVAIPLGTIMVLFIGIRIWSFVRGRTGEPNGDGARGRHRDTAGNSDAGGWYDHHVLGCDGHDAGDGGGGGGGGD